jgi:hypothetical protein
MLICLFSANVPMNCVQVNLFWSERPESLCCQLLHGIVRLAKSRPRCWLPPVFPAGVVLIRLHMYFAVAPRHIGCSEISTVAIRTGSRAPVWHSRCGIARISGRPMRIKWSTKCSSACNAELETMSCFLQSCWPRNGISRFVSTRQKQATACG